jgi:hypothetical protein
VNTRRALHDYKQSRRRGVSGHRRATADAKGYVVQAKMPILLAAIFQAKRRVTSCFAKALSTSARSTILSSASSSPCAGLHRATGKLSLGAQDSPARLRPACGAD